jgi:hypothetical protein
MLTPAAGLGRAARVHQTPPDWHSQPSQEGEDKLAPRRVQDAFRRVWIAHHVGDAQVFKHNPIIPLNEIVRELVLAERDPEQLIVEGRTYAWIMTDCSSEGGLAVAAGLRRAAVMATDSCSWPRTNDDSGSTACPSAAASAAKTRQNVDDLVREAVGCTGLLDRAS